MKNEILRDALSRINEGYLAESDDFKSVAEEFRKQRALRKRALTSVLCLAFIGGGAAGVSRSGILKRELPAAEGNVSILSSAETKPAVSEPGTAAPVIETQQPVSEGTMTDELLYYSRLTKNTAMPELEGYAGNVMPDIAAFDESMLNDSAAVIEGEILDVWVNQYEYATLSSKFESDGRVYHKPQTVAYKVRVDRVLSGIFSVGDVVTVEDQTFVCDPAVSVKKGSSYVIPIGMGDGKFCEPYEIAEGDTSLESCYFTLYQFHPQIEKVSGGYIVPEDWTTLITEDCPSIIMDIAGTGIPFSDALYYVPENIFNDRITLIIP